jgi:hypothetical protein
VSIIGGFRKYLKDPVTFGEANSYFKKYYSFVFGLRRFLEDTITLEEARETIRYRIENREENFLKIVEKGVYEYKRSPYLKLLKLAGFEYSDVKNLVLNEGLESTLKNLKEEGVYISYEESKRNKPIVRQKKTIEIKESDYHNPHTSSYYEGRTGGSRSRGTKIHSNFDFLEQKAVYDSVLNDIYGLQEAPTGIWFHVLPVLSGINRILVNAKIGVETAKWFTPLDPRANIVHRVNGWILNGMIYEGRLFGYKMPNPEFVHLNNSLIIGRWIESMLKDAGECTFYAMTSQAVRICIEGKDNGLELDGAKFITGSEPITNAKRKVIESVGAIMIPFYVMSECSHIGYGCKNPINVDEVHFFKDSLALIQGKKFSEKSEAESLFLTNLLSSAPRMMLNMETDDFGIIELRECDCKFQDLGFTEHIHDIRSFSKLTCEGVTFPGIDLIKVLEEDLPELFGGGPLDYQLIEREEIDGISKVILNVSPNVGEINKKNLKKKFFELINPSMRNTNALMWETGETIKVERNPPIQTQSGKILPINIINSPLS